MLCKFCGKLVTGKRCLCCGSAVSRADSVASGATASAVVSSADSIADCAPYSYTPPAKSNEKKTNGFAIAAFVMSLTIYLFLFGLIFGIIGLVKSRSTGGSGKGLAIAAIVISSIVVLIAVIVQLYIFFYNYTRGFL